MVENVKGNKQSIHNKDYLIIYINIKIKHFKRERDKVTKRQSTKRK